MTAWPVFATERVLVWASRRAAQWVPSVAPAWLLATYRIRMEDGTLYRQPVRCPGPEGAGRESATGAHIQDWWADYPRFQNENARMVLVAEDEDPLRYERYLYTLRWKKPTPDVRIRNIEIVMGSLGAAKLGILAITRAFVPSDKKGGSRKGGGRFVRRGV